MCRVIGGLRRWGCSQAVKQVAGNDANLARVVQVDRGECDAVTEWGIVRVSSDSVRAQSQSAPVTGDWVVVTGETPVAIITKVLPRSTALTRGDSRRGTEQVLAANFDVVGIVAGLDRPLPPGRFERMLVMARDSGAATVVLLTKADRAADGAHAAAEMVKAIAREVEVLVVSVRSGQGLDRLQGYIGPGRTLALVGASGSGKSSLVNALAGAEIAATGAVRRSDSRGRHTTIARRLVLLPGNRGLMLDTPGIRALGLADASEALNEVFGDITELGLHCRFADCAHGAEPDCAVHAAIKRDEMDQRRLERFVELRCEIEQRRVAGRDRR